MGQDRAAAVCAAGDIPVVARPQPFPTVAPGTWTGFLAHAAR
ncbi:hypothetical protein [Streptomyces misionensis]